jgi:hypothetical protein
MKKVAILALVALALLAFGGLGQSYAADNSVTVTMNALNGSNETGTATITDMGGGQIQVVVNLSNGTSTPQPAHIHKGTCANLNPAPLYPLSNVVDGKSTTTVATTLQNLESGSYAVNVHKSAAEVTTYVSCGDILATQTSASGGGQTMPATGNGDSALILLALTMLAVGLVLAGTRLARTRA